jgi:HEAT repeat protein
MLKLIEKRFGIAIPELKRLTHFMVLGLLIMGSTAIALTIGRSLFLAKAGPKYLPLFLIMMPLILMMVSGGFTWIIDRCDRLKLFSGTLLAASITIIGLRSLLSLNTVAVYFGPLIFAWVAYVLLFRIKFWTLASDYFTSLELKRYTAFLALGSSLGYLLGSTLVGVLSKFMTLENQLLLIPGLYAIAIAEIVYLQKDQKPILTQQSEPPEKSEGLQETLKIIPQLLGSYPMIFYLGISAFGLEMVRAINEVQHSIIYTETFTDAQNLASFIGLVTAALTALQLILITFVTTPLIQKLGIKKMNLVYPLANLVSFIGLAVNFRLPSAIGAHFTYRTLLYSIGIPVTNLNYNAVPPQLVGRIRVISEGIFTPMGRIGAGVILLIAQPICTQLQISLFGMMMSGMLVIVGYLTGKSYLESLIEMLRSGSATIDRVKRGFHHVRHPSVEQVRHLLMSNHDNPQLLGLELAAHLKHPETIFPELATLLPNADAAIRRAVVRLASQTHHSLLIDRFEDLLASPDATIRSLALEVLIACGRSIQDDRLSSLLADQNQEVKAIACVAATSQGTTNDIEAACETLWHSTSDRTPAKAAVRSVMGRYSREPEFISQLEKILRGAPATVKRETLETLATIAQPHDRFMGKIGVTQVNDPAADVRGAAFHLLGVVQRPEILSYIAKGLEDADSGVRMNSALALAAYGDRSLSVVKSYLSSSRREVVEAAIAAIAKVGTTAAEALLFEHLYQDFKWISPSQRWQQRIPHNQPGFSPLLMAIDDYHQRVLDRLFYVLSCFGHSRVVSYAQRRLYSGDRRERANAVEALTSLPQRRFVLPVMPLLEQFADGVVPPLEASSASVNSDWMETTGLPLLQEALKCRDRWIKVGALFGLVESKHIQSSDPSGLNPSHQQLLSQQCLIQRLHLLKQVSLFHYLTLDELLLIERAIIPQEVPEGEIIFTEGSLADHLYIIAAGKVTILKQVNNQPKELTKLSVGEYFGEMSLFDDQPHSATVFAATDCTLFKLEQERFSEFIHQYPQILLEISKELSHRLRKTNQMLEYT